jgi:alpha-1,3-rhamnosyltransferase
MEYSFEIIQAYKQECQQRFTRYEFRHRPNQGVSRTLNEALEWSKGTYFSTLASDDIMLPDKTMKQINQFKKEPKDTLGLFGSEININAQGGVIKANKRPNQYIEFEDVFYRYAFLCPSTAMVRTQTHNVHGGYSAVVVTADCHLWLKLLEQGGRMHNTGEFLIKKRSHSTNVSNKHKLMLYSNLKIATKYKKHQGYKKAKAHIYLAQFYHQIKTSPKRGLIYLIKALITSPNILIDKKLKEGGKNVR